MAQELQYLPQQTINPAQSKINLASIAIALVSAPDAVQEIVNLVEGTQTDIKSLTVTALSIAIVIFRTYYNHRQIRV